MRAANVLHLGIKEFRSLLRDPMMIVLIVFAFTVAIYSAATAMPESLNKAPIAIVDEDGSPLSIRIADAFYPPFFLPPSRISAAQMDARMDAGLDTFALDIPPNFQRDVLAGRAPSLQLNVDATRVSQAFTGAGYIQSIVTGEVNAFVAGARVASAPAVDLALRMRFNPELNKSWFGAVMEVVNNVTMLSIVLTGAALIREREHGTVEHLLAMPVTPFEIMASKVWAMAVVVLVAAGLSLALVVQGLLEVPIEGSVALFLVGRRAAPVRHDVDGHLPRHRRAVDAAIRPAAAVDPAAPRGAFGRRDAARKHARIHPGADDGGADHAFRRAGAGHPVPRCRPRRRLAAVPRARPDRRHAVRAVAGAVPQDAGDDGVTSAVLTVIVAAETTARRIARPVTTRT